MRILQIVQKPQLRGAEIFAAQLAQTLLEMDHQVALLFLFPGEDLLPFKGLKIHLHGDQSHRLLDFRGYRRLAKIIQEFRPDIVQANAGDTLKYASLSKAVFGWKGKLIFRNANLISGFIGSYPKRLFNKVLLRQVDAVASVSELCKQDFITIFNWKKSIAFLPIGIEAYSENKLLPVELAKGLAGRPFLIHIGSFVPEKNHLGLLRIFKRIQEFHPQICLVLIGEGSLRKEIEIKSEDQVFFLGKRQEIFEILSHAEALVLPSLIEGLPGVLLEAMISKVPVVAYDVGGVSEIVKHLDTGFLIPKGEEELFSLTIIDQILNPKAELSELIQNAFENIQKKYALQTISDQFLKFYNSLLNPSDANSYS